MINFYNKINFWIIFLFNFNEMRQSIGKLKKKNNNKFLDLIKF